MTAARMPVAFASHGAPSLALDAGKGADFVRWGRALPRPRAVLAVSAHWERTPVAVGTRETRDLDYDFGGFDPALRELQYPAPGAPALADRVAGLLGAERRDERRWDHGVWVPLVHLFPQADVPLLQVSLPSSLDGRGLFEVGRALRPLRDEGVLLLASGGLVHALHRLDWSDASPPPRWATAFEDWARAALVAHDVDALLDFRARAPYLDDAHPTLEHFQPLLVALGAAHAADPVTFPVEGFEYGSLSRTAVQWG